VHVQYTRAQLASSARYNVAAKIDSPLTSARNKSEHRGTPDAKKSGRFAVLLVVKQLRDPPERISPVRFRRRDFSGGVSKANNLRIHLALSRIRRAMTLRGSASRNEDENFLSAGFVGHLQRTLRMSRGTAMLAAGVAREIAPTGRLFPGR